MQVHVHHSLTVLMVIILGLKQILTFDMMIDRQIPKQEQESFGFDSRFGRLNLCFMQV
jgi:hypothetical protein